MIMGRAVLISVVRSCDSDLNRRFMDNQIAQFTYSTKKFICVAESECQSLSVECCTCACDLQITPLLTAF